MRSRECIALLALFAATVCGCASAPTSPPDWLPDATEVQSSPHGGWIEVDFATTRGIERMDGELLAIQGDRVFVIIGDAVRSAPIDSVRGARLTWYDSKGGNVVGWTVLGTVSTISNGYFLVFTAPMWMIGGSIAANSRYNDPILKSPDHSWDEIRPYARFPQGIPAGFLPEKPSVVATTGVEPEPPPPTLQPRTSGGTQWGFALGAGVTKYDVDNDSKGQGVLTGVNVSNKWATAGVRMALGFSDYNSNVVDLGLLLGVRGRFHAFALALRAGPALWGVSFGDLVDFHGSFAAQGELVVYLWPSIGIGALVAYNDNDYIDFTVVTLGIVFGPR